MRVGARVSLSAWVHAAMLMTSSVLIAPMVTYLVYRGAPEKRRYSLYLYPPPPRAPQPVLFQLARLKLLPCVIIKAVNVDAE